MEKTQESAQADSPPDTIDWISLFLQESEGISSPFIFRKWTAISTIAAVLERRVWSVTARSPIYPNLYCLLVGPAGVGKSESIALADKLLRGIKDIYIAPSSVTKASLIDRLAEASRKVVSPTKLYDYHFLTAIPSEFTVFLESFDFAFMSTLTDLWDCRASFEQSRRTNNLNLSIIRPGFNLLSGTTPSGMTVTFPQEAWGMGFSARILMIWSGQKIKVPLFSKGKEKPLNPALLGELKQMLPLFGEFTWTEEARKAIMAADAVDFPPIPAHSRLQHYNTRRVMSVIKLSMIAAVSRTRKLVVELQDFQRALNWLLEIEALMPDIFRAMVGKSDQEVLLELHRYAWRLFVENKQTPIHESRLFSFLTSRVPSDKVKQLLDIAERSRMLSRIIETKAGQVASQSYFVPLGWDGDRHE